MIKYIQILGERYSGTNYLAALIRNNIPAVEITESFGFKHWFIKDHQPRSAPNSTTDFECVRSLNHSDDTLFLVILRNPFDWLRSLARYPQHAPDHVGLSFSKQRVKHIAFINYENLYENSSTLVDVADNFDISIPNRQLIDEPRYLKGGAVQNELFVPKKYKPIIKYDLEFIESTLDWDIEESINYKFSGYLDKIE